MTTTVPAGLRLHAGEYRALPSVAMVGVGLGLHSEALGLELRHDADGRLRFHDPESGEDLPAHEEMRERVEEEIAGRRDAEARLRKSEARLEDKAAAHRTTKARLAVECAPGRALAVESGGKGWRLSRRRCQSARSGVLLSRSR